MRLLVPYLIYAKAARKICVLEYSWIESTIGQVGQDKLTALTKVAFSHFLTFEQTNGHTTGLIGLLSQAINRLYECNDKDEHSFV